MIELNCQFNLSSIAVAILYNAMLISPKKAAAAGPECWDMNWELCPSSEVVRHCATHPAFKYFYTSNLPSHFPAERVIYNWQFPAFHSRLEESSRLSPLCNRRLSRRAEPPIPAAARHRSRKVLFLFGVHCLSMGHIICLGRNFQIKAERGRRGGRQRFSTFLTTKFLQACQKRQSLGC